MQEGPDPAMAVALLPLAEATPGARDAATLDAVLAFSDAARDVAPGGVVMPGKQPANLRLDGRVTRFDFRVERPGAYALFTEHHPEEFNARLESPSGEPVIPILAHAHKPDHEHDEEVSSVGIDMPGDLNEKKLNKWMGELLQTKGADIFRMKGVLSIKGNPNRFVFQGVHMLLDARPDREWGDEPRHNKLVFIGRNLDRGALTEGFRSCLA
jgi:G3E family GTPase